MAEWTVCLGRSDSTFEILKLGDTYPGHASFWHDNTLTLFLFWPGQTIKLQHSQNTQTETTTKFLITSSSEPKWFEYLFLRKKKNVYFADRFSRSQFTKIKVNFARNLVHKSLTWKSNLEFARMWCFQYAGHVINKFYVLKSQCQLLGIDLVGQATFNNITWLVSERSYWYDWFGTIWRCRMKNPKPWNTDGYMVDNPNWGFCSNPSFKKKIYIYI